MRRRPIDPWVKQICEDAGFKTELFVGGVFPHPTRKGVKVKIVDGQGWAEGGWSNFWYWRIVKPGGKLGRLQHGYGWM